MRARLSTVIVALLAAGFFFAPAAARITGHRATPIENHPLAKFPSLDQGWDIFDALTQWTTDHLPLRARAIRFNNRLSNDVFGEEPAVSAAQGPVGVGQAPKLSGEESGAKGAPGTSPVVRGDDGWLYLGVDFTRACNPSWQIPRVLRGVQRLASIVRASGRDFVFAVPPDKSTIERSRLPDDYPLGPCAERAHRARIAALRRLALPGYVELQAPLEARERRQHKPIYLSLDTHWTQVGALLYGRGLAEEIDPRLLRHTRVEPAGEVTAIGDLSRFVGDPQPVTQPAFRLVRAGVSAPRTTRQPFYPGRFMTRERRTSSPGGAALYPYRTALHGSSFTGDSADKVDPYFADITRLPQLLDAATAGHLREAEQALINLIKRSRLLIWEQVEREFWGQREGSLIRPEFLDRLQRALQDR